jgi:hypothetical protein
MADKITGLGATGAYNATVTVLQGKYNEAITLSDWARSVLELKLDALATKDEQFNVTAFFTAAEKAITDIPVLTPPGDITYSYVAPTVPTWEALSLEMPTDVSPESVVYAAPTAPAYGDITYAEPTAPTYDPLAYAGPNKPTYSDLPFTAPSLGNMLTAPSFVQHDAGVVPDTAITFDNPDFINALSEQLQQKLSADLTSGSTGLGDAEAGMFNRAVQRERDALLESYNQVTTQFSARGFDMPPGAINALIAQESNKSTIRLTDVNTGILETSAKLAQAWNQTTVTASSQVIALRPISRRSSATHSWKGNTSATSLPPMTIPSRSSKRKCRGKQHCLMPIPKRIRLLFRNTLLRSGPMLLSLMLMLKSIKRMLGNIRQRLMLPRK